MWLTTWTEPGSPFPAYAEHATEVEAEQAARSTSLRLGVEVAVVPVRGADMDEYAEASK